MSKSGYVYFIGNVSHKILKIGFTTRINISKRIKELQTGSPYVLSLFKSIKGNTVIEKLYHSALYKYSLNPNGEWFRLCLDTALFCQLDDSIVQQLHTNILNTSTDSTIVRKYDDDDESISIEDLYSYM
jgi:hypothetical protein